MMRPAGTLAALPLAALVLSTPVHAQFVSLPWQTTALAAAPTVAPAAACDYSMVPGIVWWGTEREMTVQRLAEYAAPIYWFSPDEPTLNDTAGTAIRVPAALPFEPQPDNPVVYYQYNEIGVRQGADGPGYRAGSGARADAVLDLHDIISLNLKYIAYFPREEGLGGHAHDVEPAAFRLWVLRSTDAKQLEQRCDELTYVIGVMRVTGEAHGLEWYFNVLNTDRDTKFPMTLIVEEGKHAMSTDKNGDGYYTPGFDVNVRVNDAWGVRDIIRGGALFTGGYEAWMAKVRRPEHRVFPPLPADSWLRPRFVERGTYVPDNAVYELRPFPASTAAGDDELLRHKMAEKEAPNWPDLSTVRSRDELTRWADAGLALKSFAISVRADGDLGLSFVFPLFIVKNFEDPMSGGFIVHRMYLKDTHLRDFGWMLMYTPSASRWIDTYLAAGYEGDTETVEPVPGDTTAATQVTYRNFVMETGIKFRVNITKSPLKFLSFLTEFMGLRAGIKNTGFFDIDRLTYVFEFGAGVW